MPQTGHSPCRKCGLELWAVPMLPRNAIGRGAPRDLVTKLLPCVDAMKMQMLMPGDSHKPEEEYRNAELMP